MADRDSFGKSLSEVIKGLAAGHQLGLSFSLSSDRDKASLDDIWKLNELFHLSQILTTTSTYSG